MNKQRFALAAILCAVAAWLLWPDESEPVEQATVEEPQHDSENEPTMPRPTAPQPETETEDDRCAHPLVPDETGVWRTYQLVVPQGQGVLELRLQRRSIDGLGLIDEWKSSINFEGMPPLQSVSRHRCHPEEGAQVPWSFVSMAGVAEVDVRWRWPAEFAPDVRFGGDVVVTLLGQEHAAHRAYHVVGREEVVVPQGMLSAWRVDFTDTAEGHAPLVGTVWVNQEVGLVRSSRESAPGQRTTMELLDFGSE